MVVLLSHSIGHSYNQRLRGLREPVPMTAQDTRGVTLNEYSYSIFFSISNAGCIEAGARRTDGEPGWFESSPRYRTNSSSLRCASRTYCESSTMTIPLLGMPRRSNRHIPIGPSPDLYKKSSLPRRAILFLRTLAHNGSRTRHQDQSAYFFAPGNGRGFPWRSGTLRVFKSQTKRASAKRMTTPITIALMSVRGVRGLTLVLWIYHKRSTSAQNLNGQLHCVNRSTITGSPQSSQRKM
jgi:hypothetical protein